MTMQKSNITTKKQRKRRETWFLSAVGGTLLVMFLSGLWGGSSLEASSVKKWVKSFHGNSPVLQSLMYVYRYGLVNYLGISPRKNVVFGKDGWMYFSEVRAETSFAESHLRAIPYDDPGIARRAEILKNFADELKKRGVRFYLVVAPDKQSIYPEYLPAHFGPIAEPTRKDQFFRYFLDKYPQHKDIVVDLKSGMVAKKETGLLYYKTDTHWTGLGALAAYGIIADRWQADGVISSGEIVPSPTFSEGTYIGDIVTFALKLKGKPIEKVKAGAPQSCRSPGDQSADNWERGAVTKSDCPTAPFRRLVLIEDSFMRTNLWNYLSHHFSHVTRYFREVDRSFITEIKERPDIVVLQTVERFLPSTIEQLEDIDLSGSVRRRKCPDNAKDNQNCYPQSFAASHSVGADL